MGILGVVTVHVIILYVLSGDSSSSTEEVSLMSQITGSLTTAVMEMLYSALIGFFVITGYFFRPNRSYSAYLKGRILPLAVLFFACVLVLNSITYVYLLALGYDLPFDEFLCDMAELMVGKEPFADMYTHHGEFILALNECTHQLYFLQALIIASIVFYATATRVISSPRNLCIAILAALIAQGLYISLVAVHLPFNAELAPMALAFLYVGAYLGKYRLVERFLSMERGKRYWGIFLAVTVLGIILFAFFPTKMSYIWGYFGKYGGWSVFPYFVSEALGVVFLIYLSSWLIKVRFLGNAFLVMGTYSLAIFVLHMFFVKLLIAPFVELDYHLWVPFGLPWGIPVVILSVLLCIATAKVLKPLSDRVMKVFA